MIFKTLAFDSDKYTARLEGHLRDRAAYLSSSDQELLELVIFQERTLAYVSSLSVNMSARSVGIRVHNILRRMNSEPYRRAICALKYLELSDARAARLYYCEGYSYRKLATLLGITGHQARRLIDRLEGAILSSKRLRSLVMQYQE